MNASDQRNRPAATDLPLRAAAEARLDQDRQARGPEQSAAQLLHELQVHQIELEMQNEALRQAKLDLEESRDRYVDLYELAPVGYLTLSADGMIADINLTGTAMLGMDRRDVLRRSFSAFVAIQDQQRWSDDFGNAQGATPGGRIELAMRRADGTVFHAQLDYLVGSAPRAAHPASSEVRLALTDVTERRRQESLLQSGTLQAAIIQSANFSSIATDARGVIQVFNIGAERMLGYSAREVLNKVTPAELSDPQELLERARALSAEQGTPIAPGFEALVYKASRGVEDVYELTYLRKDGSRLPAVVSVTALRDALGVIIGFLLIGTDNRARHRVEAERLRLIEMLEERNAELERATLAAEHANQAKSEFLSSMSHELRTPLGAMLGFAQLLDAGPTAPTPAQKRSIDQILKAGWYLLELINEILDLAVIESGRLALELEATSVADTLRDCEAMIEPQAQSSGISVDFGAPSALLFVSADRLRLKQVLVNLLSNAIKYNRPGGSVAVSCAASGASRVRINVRDSGAGLTPAQLAQLFESFNRLGQESGGIEGTGIGLVVCKRLVDRMGGAIGAHSTLGVGSDFWIELERASAPPDLSPDDAPWRDTLSDGLSGAPMYTVLYVEDQPSNVAMMKEIFERRPGIRLLTAVDGADGVEQAREGLPDVILMDISLPGMSGLDAVEVLAQDPTTACIPVIALSANAMPEDVQRGLAAGCRRYLTKPIRIDEFLTALDEVLAALPRR